MRRWPPGLVYLGIVGWAREEASFGGDGGPKETETPNFAQKMRSRGA